MDELTNWLTGPQSIPIWVIIVLWTIKNFRDELAIFVPNAIKDHFAARARRKMGEQKHQQELEEAGLEHQFQANINAQLQLIQVNEKLVDFLTKDADERLEEIDRVLRDVRDLQRTDQAHSKIVQMEWARIVDTLGQVERLLVEVGAAFRAGQEGKSVRPPD